MYIRNCKLCGKEFETRFPAVNVCIECKNRPCEVCGKTFLHPEPYDQHCCSKECRLIWRKMPEHVAELNAKRKATVVEKYGVDNVSKLDSVKSKISESMRDPLKYTKKKLAEQVAEKASRAPLIRNCILCGKEFNAVGSQTTCAGPHYRKCVVCGNDFEYKHMSDKAVTCSCRCTAMLRKQTLLSIERTCEWCGKTFFSDSDNTKYCEGPHYKKCVVCGKDFEVDLKRNQSNNATCSNECRQALTESTCMSKYGYARPSQTPEAREHNRIKTLQNAEQTKQTNLERYGYPYATQNPKIRQRLSDKTNDPEIRAKTRATTLARYGVEYAMQSPKVARKHSTSQFSQTALDGTTVDSSWEKDIYNFLLRNGISFEYNTHTIPYEYKGINHVTHIDFKVGDLLLEVKGGHLLQGAYSDAPGVVPINVKLDVYKKNHVVIVTDSECKDMFGKPNSKISNGLKYLDKCPESLIGVDISLFSEPSFPFADDRPTCFYKVKVDGEQSSFEAFYNERIRWNMIINRINYTGGFIDAKQILTAMNVTRTCKQPSWFSKSLAKRIIQTYASSDIIVDPFAGWGMRHDAAVELGKQYVGSDLNPELVNWHQNRGRNIQLADAKEFQFSNKCSVFICPPYSDPNTGRCFEDYNFEGFDESAKSLSQCDWLKVVMNNVPNASEYIMVCKIVDEEFKPYIKEVITNQSHFGANNEYVLVIPNAAH